MRASNWQDYEEELRADWERKFSRTGLDWGEIREAHRFGWDAALRPEFANVEFGEAETDLSRHWYRPLLATEEMSWDYVREAAQEGWHRARDHASRHPREQERGR